MAHTASATRVQLQPARRRAHASHRRAGARPRPGLDSRRRDLARAADSHPWSVAVAAAAALSAGRILLQRSHGFRTEDGDARHANAWAGNADARGRRPRPVRQRRRPCAVFLRQLVFSADLPGFVGRRRKTLPARHARRRDGGAAHVKFGGKKFGGRIPLRRDPF